jgi:hypothetical protein
MDTRERRNDRLADLLGMNPSRDHGGGGSGGGGALGAIRREAEQFLAAADRAIDRALSGDSEAFVRASRQQGGE